MIAVLQDKENEKKVLFRERVKRTQKYDVSANIGLRWNQWAKLKVYNGHMKESVIGNGKRAKVFWNSSLKKKVSLSMKEDVRNGMIWIEKAKIEGI